MSADFFVKILDAVQQRHPLVHQITNYVTATDCANATLAIGGSPVMAHSILETADMAALAQAVLLNIGTPDADSAETMLKAGQVANRNKTPVILDPVGAGATPFRKELCETLLNGMQVDILRGNQAEIRALLQLSSRSRGVDSLDDQEDFGELAMRAAKEFRCIAAVTGRVDCISDGRQLIRIANEHPLLQQVTGTGCMCSALCATCAGACPENLLEAAATGVAISGTAGEIAAENLLPHEGTGTFHLRLMDAFSKMTGKLLQQKTRMTHTQPVF